jgi:adenylate cyclase
MSDQASFSDSGLADASGVPLELITEMTELGILEPDSGSFGPNDVNRVRLIQTLYAEGISLEAIGKAVAAGNLSFEWIESVLVRPITLAHKTYGEMARELDISFPDLRRIFASWGLPAPVEDQRARSDDEAALQVLHVFRDFGLGTEVMIAGTRAFGENVRRIADHQIAFFRANVIDPLRAAGTPARDVMGLIAPVSGALQPVGEELVHWLHVRHLESVVLQETMQVLEEILEEAGITEGRQKHVPAIAFLDLTGFTRLTESAGDEVALELASSLSDLVAQAAQEHDGRVVKLLGDGVMFYFPQVVPAVRCGLDLVELIPASGLPPARVGVSAGHVIMRDGDYFGRTVNIASRITDYARPGEVLVDDSIAGAHDIDGAAFEAIGPVLLKGLSQPLALSRAQRMR